MSTKTNADLAGVSVPGDEQSPLDLHDLYHQQEAAGYSRDLTLPSHVVQSLAQSLRGINAVTAVLIAGDNETLRLGDWLRGGLIEAANALSWSMSNDLERANEHAARAQKGGAA